MLGKIISVEENEAKIKLNINLEEIPNLINLYVIMEDNANKIIGEITDIIGDVAKVNLLGKIDGDKFEYGIINKPSFSSTIKLVSKEKMPLIIGVEKVE